MAQWQRDCLQTAAVSSRVIANDALPSRIPASIRSWPFFKSPSGVRCFRRGAGALALTQHQPTRGNPMEQTMQMPFGVGASQLVVANAGAVQ